MYMTVKFFCLYVIKIDVWGYHMSFYIPDDSLEVGMTRFVRPAMLLRRTHVSAAIAGRAYRLAACRNLLTSKRYRNCCSFHALFLRLSLSTLSCPSIELPDLAAQKSFPPFPP